MSLIDDFFTNILTVRLDEPATVNLRLSDSSEDLPAIVVPKIDESGRLTLNFYEVDFENGVKLSQNMSDPKPLTVQLQGSRSVEGVISRVSAGWASTGSIAVFNEIIVSERPIKAALFALVDFPKFFGSGASYTLSMVDSDSPDHPGMQLMGRANLLGRGWEIQISECPDKDENQITHTGYIIREDQQEFSIKSLKSAVQALNYFLTFVTGVYRQPTVILARDSDYRYVWGRLNRFRQERYFHDNWFEPARAGSIQKLFPGFFDYFVEHENEVSKVIEYYAESSMVAHIGLHKIALNESQSALEGLSTLVLGRDKGRSSAREFCGKALQELDINHDLAEFPYLLETWRRNQKTDSDDDSGLTYITRLRNQFMHPKFLETEIPEYYYVWNLCQRYVELGLLKLFSYEGDYRDRLSQFKAK